MSKATFKSEPKSATKRSSVPANFTIDMTKDDDSQNNSSLQAGNPKSEKIARSQLDYLENIGDITNAQTNAVDILIKINDNLLDMKKLLVKIDQGIAALNPVD